MYVHLINGLHAMVKKNCKYRAFRKCYVALCYMIASIATNNANRNKAKRKCEEKKNAKAYQNHTHNPIVIRVLKKKKKMENWKETWKSM